MQPILQLDLCVSESNFEEDAKQILQHVRPSWRQEDIKFKVFTDGITNKLLGCYVGNKLDNNVILVRVNGQGTDIIIDRKEEQETYRVLSEAGLAPPVHCVFDNGMAYGFYAGCPLDEKSVREPRIQRLIAEEKVRLQQVRGSYADGFQGKIPSEYQKRTQIFLDKGPTHFEDKAKEELFVSTIPTKSQLQAELDCIVKELESLNMDVVYSHNDLLLKNIIFNEEKGTIHFIDFEYAFYNYEPFDIANHFAEYAGLETVDYDLYPTKEEQLPWLQHFLHSKAEAHGKSKDSVTEKDLERLYIQTNKCACAAHFYWGVWALIQAKYSTIDFDYISYSDIRLKEYFRRKEEFFPLQLPL